MTPLNRSEIRQRVLPAAEFPLWVPLLTHYRQEQDRLAIDTARMQRQAAEVRRSIRLWMLAGTTGDGWELSETQFDAPRNDWLCSKAAVRTRPGEWRNGVW